ncbi:Aluminum-activated malate transporter 10 [Dichanthelium oligosanthes]|uniref:Aluminum-activated malate transporter 10 n=1 Tax=Dichanthelium oligosanthes TaxID=888268 RepID=A0A1E5WF19_9POAL|nr:Aluminum-activated malate transporter 10 [Dichanthelium oligosanthes]
MEMATAKGAQYGPNAPQWRVTVPEGPSVTVEHEAGRAWAWAWLGTCVLAFRDKAIGFGSRVWRIGADDPRRAVHGLKVGLALALVSVFYYTRPLYDGVGGAAMWAVLTVIVIFEYTVGGCVYKGFNRAFATASAAVVALGVHWIASKSGDKFEPFIRSGSVFLLAAMATFSRFIPTVKARFDYGVTIFILTYSLVAVSGYRVGALVAMAQQRVWTISIGVAMCIAICALICPVWAGQELHRATARNLERLAGAVEACVEDYFAAAEATSNSKQPSSKAEGYKCVLNSKASEDSQANLARWEPPHGRFGFRHPYGQYRNVGAAMRHCAYCVEALNGCVRSAEVQPPAPAHARRRHLADACTRVAALCARVLREASGSVSAMTTSRILDFAVAEMNTAVQELQADLRALPYELLLAEAGSAEHMATSPLMEAAQLFTVTSLLIEVSARIEGVVDAIDTLASLANFKSSADGEKPAESATKAQPVINPGSE